MWLRQPLVETRRTSHASGQSAPFRLSWRYRSRYNSQGRGQSPSRSKSRWPFPRKRFQEPKQPYSQQEEDVPTRGTADHHDTYRTSPTYIASGGFFGTTSRRNIVSDKRACFSIEFGYGQGIGRPPYLFTSDILQARWIHHDIKAFFRDEVRITTNVAEFIIANEKCSVRIDTDSQRPLHGPGTMHVPLIIIVGRTTTHVANLISEQLTALWRNAVFLLSCIVHIIASGFSKSRHRDRIKSRGIFELTVQATDITDDNDKNVIHVRMCCNVLQHSASIRPTI
jgi:hypothetical protein